MTDFTKPTPLIVDSFSDIEPGNALDIGAGYGRNSIYLSYKGWTVDALDTDAKSLEYIDIIARKNRLIIRTISQDIMRYDTPKEYDAIICLMMLHFMNMQDIESTIKWIKKHTKPGGIVAVSGFNTKNVVGTRPYLFAENELADYFSEWTTQRYDEDSLSSVLNQKTHKIDTFHVSRIVTKKP